VDRLAELRYRTPVQLHRHTHTHTHAHAHIYMVPTRDYQRCLNASSLSPCSPLSLCVWLCCTSRYLVGGDHGVSG
jgi:hypothetical protein